VGEGFFEELEGVGAAEVADDDAGVGHWGLGDGIKDHGPDRFGCRAKRQRFGVVVVR
jgi:hypothetical protein